MGRQPSSTRVPENVSKQSPAFFYKFLAAHSLLIGLLPFFLPVYLWQHGLSLAGLCILVGVSGLSFVAALRIWQRLFRRPTTRLLITTTFALELLLVVVVGLFTTVPGAALFMQQGVEQNMTLGALLLAAVIIGIANGLYNAFFWTTQRCLFLQILGNNDTGKQYGNFQIFVTLFLKAGILLGGVLLDTGGFIWLLALSAGISFSASTWLSGTTLEKPALKKIPATLMDSLRYTDKQGSREVFTIDGLFLYLESHFWTLSLFLLVSQDFSRLGLTVVILALVFGVVFFLLKNRIDQLPVERVYRAAVWLYAGSWLLRFTLDSNSQGNSMLVALVVITFCSSFFRLAFNKRFFDVARKGNAVEYLLIKSYSSQSYLGLLFLSFGALLLAIPVTDSVALQYAYLPVAALSLIYLKYREHGSSP